MARFRVVGVLALLALLAACSRRVVPGQPAPEFRLPSASGQVVSPETYRGKVVLLNFWASWCQPCIEETPGLNALQRAFPSSQFVVLGVSVDVDPAACLRFARREQIDFPIAFDPDADVPNRYGTKQYPESYVIDRRGIVVRKIVSTADWDSPAMLSYFRDLIATP